MDSGFALQAIVQAMNTFAYLNPQTPSFKNWGVYHTARKLVLVGLLCMAAIEPANAQTAVFSVPSDVISSGQALLKIEYEPSSKEELECAKSLAGKQKVPFEISVQQETRTSSSQNSIYVSSLTHEKWRLAFAKQFDASTKEMDVLIGSIEKCRTGFNSNLKWTASKSSK